MATTKKTPTKKTTNPFANAFLFNDENYVKVVNYVDPTGQEFEMAKLKKLTKKEQTIVFNECLNYFRKDDKDLTQKEIDKLLKNPAFLLQLQDMTLLKSLEEWAFGVEITLKNVENLHSKYKDILDKEFSSLIQQDFPNKE